MTARTVAFGLALAIGLFAFAGSAAELWRIAERAHYGVPLGLVAALDGLAVVCVIVLAARKDWQALLALVAATALSIGLQILAVPTNQPLDLYVSAVAVHALVPLASFMAVHLATRIDRPEPAETKAASSSPKVKAKAAPKATKAPAPPSKPAPSTGTTEATRAEATTSEPEAEAGPPALSRIEAAREVKAEAAAEAKPLTRAFMMDGLRARGHGVAKDTAMSLIRQLEAEADEAGPHFHLIEGSGT